MKITRYAVQRRLATGAILIALLVMGIYGAMQLPVNFLPDVTYPMIRVHIWWRGATPDEILKNIADPVERQMATVDGLDNLESSSIEGMYTLRVNFQYGVDIDVAYQDALAAMARVARQLPPEIDPPIVIKADPSQLPVLQLTIGSEQWDLVQLRDWTDNWLQGQLLAVPGVAGTEIVGGLKREIRVYLDADALEKHGLSLSGVIRRLREENIEQFGGRVTVGGREFIARTTDEFTGIEDIESIVLARSDFSVVLLKDVARIVDEHEEVRVVTRLDGEPCVKLSVLKQADANTVEVAKAVQRRIEELESVLPSGMQIAMLENQAEYIESALSGVKNAAMQAAVLVILVVFLFLGSFRQVLVMMLALPITLVLNFALMRLAGFSLNIFSLGGLVVSIGVLLSNTIVVVENISRWRTWRPDLSKEDCVIEATAEVGTPIVAATLTFLALFVPFLFVPGLTTLLFKELILVIAGIVLISLAVAVSVTPMLTNMLMAEQKTEDRKASRFQLLFERIIEAYGRLLGRVIRLRWFIIAGFAASAVGAVILLGHLGSEFLPQPDDGRVMVKVRMPTGTALAQTNDVLRRIEERISGDEAIDSIFTLAGGRVWGLYTYEVANEGELNIQLVPRNKRRITTQQFVQRLRPVVGQVPVIGGRAMVSQMRVRGIRRMGDADIEVRITGQEIDRLYELAEQTARTMRGADMFTNVYVSMDMTKPEYQVKLDRTWAAELGVSAFDMAQALRTLIGGTVATNFRDGGEYYAVRVLVPEYQIASKTDIENLPLANGRGGYLRLGEVADVRHAVGPVEIVREDQVMQVIVRADAAGVSVGHALSALKSAVVSMDVPPGYEFTYGGQALMMTEMKQTITGVMLFAVFFAVVVLTVQFNSLKLPALIMLCVPFCMAGLVYALLATSLPLGATVIIGVLVVVAAMANDGVLLLTFAGQLQHTERLTARESIIKAAMLRLRPIVMTTVPVIVGFIPLALNLESGGEMLQPMAAGAIGGLIFEILVALIFMPCAYVILAGKHARA